MKYAQTTEIENKLAQAGFKKEHYTIKTNLQQGNPYTDVTFKPNMLMAACQMRHALIARGMKVTIYYDANDQVWCVTATYYPGIVAGETEIGAKEAAQDDSIIIPAATVKAVKAAAQEKRKGFAIIAVPNRKIACAEYNASYGWNDTHDKVLFQYLTLRRPMEAEIEREVQGDNLIITLYFKGKYGQRNLEETNRFYDKGFILDIVY